MLYNLEQGRVEKQIIEQCVRDRKPLPDRIQNAPELLLGLELYVEAFWDLNTCRTSGWAMAPIPWTAIHQYAQAFNIKGYAFEDFFFYVRSLDQICMDYHENKEKKNQRKRPLPKKR